MDALPILIFWLLAIWGLLGRPERLLYLLFGSMSFGSFAVIPTALTAGLTLTPAPMCAVLLIFRQLSSRRGLAFALKAALFARNGLMLSMFWVVAALTTWFIPRLFAGEVTVIPMSLKGTSYGERLFPTAQNLSQAAYLSISIVSVFAFARMLRTRFMRDHAIRSIALGGGIAVITGLLDYMAQSASLSGLLEPFRTASYALLTNDEIAGGKRVVGLMPEASAYGGMVLTFLSSVYFFRHGAAPGSISSRWAPALIILLSMMIWLSTSSGAYVGFALFCLAVVLEWLWSAFRSEKDRRRRASLLLEFWFAAGAFSFGCTILLFAPSLLDPIVNQINILVFQKTSTSSYEERSMWTQVSWEALWSTYGLGVGLGGTRASNGVVSIFSSAGVLGGLFYFAFVVQSFLRRAPRNMFVEQSLMSATYWSFLPPFVAFVLAGTSPDFGLFNAFLFGMALALENSAKGVGVSCVARGNATLDMRARVTLDKRLRMLGGGK